MWEIFDNAGNLIGRITEKVHSPGPLLFFLLFFFVVIGTSINLILEHWFFLLLACLVLIALTVSISLAVYHSSFARADLSARRCAASTSTVLFVAIFVLLFLSGTLNYAGSNWFENTLTTAAAYAVLILLGFVLMTVVNFFAGAITEKIVVTRSLESFRNSSSYTPMYCHYRDLLQNHTSNVSTNPKAPRFSCTVNFETLKTFNIPCKQDNLLMVAQAIAAIALRTSSFTRYRLSARKSSLDSSVELLLY